MGTGRRSSASGVGDVIWWTSMTVMPTVSTSWASLNSVQRLFCLFRDVFRHITLPRSWCCWNICRAAFVLLPERNYVIIAEELRQPPIRLKLFPILLKHNTSSTHTGIMMHILHLTVPPFSHRFTQVIRWMSARRLTKPVVPMSGNRVWVIACFCLCVRHSE